VERVFEGIFVLAALAAAWSDARTRRIPNALTLSLIAFGIAAHGIAGGWLGALESFALAAAAIVVGSIVHSRHWLGGGDIKLIAAGVAVFGSSGALPFLVFTAMAGGVVAAAVALHQHRFVGTLSNIAYSAIVPGISLQASREYGTVPYGLAIAAGATLATLSQCFTGLRLTL
jgi:prepilin peptidase CpaA